LMKSTLIPLMICQQLLLRRHLDDEVGSYLVFTV
jgi:hypothetical protein